MVSWRYLIDLFEIYDRCPEDICSLSWIFLMGVLGYLIGVLEIFDRNLRDILTVSWIYLIGVLEIFDGYLRDI